jgi:hypothetical protein
VADVFLAERKEGAIPLGERAKPWIAGVHTLLKQIAQRERYIGGIPEARTVIEVENPDTRAIPHQVVEFEVAVDQSMYLLSYREHGERGHEFRELGV